MIICTESYGDKFVKDFSNISDISIEEACGQLQASVSDALAEMNMNIILAEAEGENSTALAVGSKLYNMSASEKDAKKSVVGSIKEKVLHIIDKVSNEIAKLWDKLVNWLRMEIESNAENAKKINVAFNYRSIYSNFDKFDKPEIHFDKYVDMKGIAKLNNTVSAIKNEFIVNGAKSSDKLTSDNIKDSVDGIFNKLEVVQKDCDITPTATDFLNNAVILYDIKKASSSIFKNILDTKAIINEEFRKLKSKTRDQYSDAAERREFMNEVNLTSRMYSMFTSEAIKIYHIFYNCAYEICKGCVTNYKAHLKADDSERRKNKFGTM